MSNLKVIGKKNILGIEVPYLFGGFGSNEKSMLAQTIAKIHGREVKEVNRLINNNCSRFIAGIHVIDLKGDIEVAVILKHSGIMTQNAINASDNIYLLSQRGYVRLLKIMDDDTAWEKWGVIENDYFEMKEQSTKPLPKTRKSTSRIRAAVKDALDTAEYIASRLGVKIGIAQAAAIKMVEENSDIKLQPLKGLLPSAEHDTAFLNATDIGQRIGESAVKTNQLLALKGLQHQSTNSKGKKEWHLTNAGKKYGEEFPYDASTGHSGYQVKWNESVINVLKEQIDDALLK